jgi:hypothetical protein
MLVCVFALPTIKNNDLDKKFQSYYPLQVFFFKIAYSPPPSNGRPGPGTLDARPCSGADVC